MPPRKTPAGPAKRPKPEGEDATPAPDIDRIKVMISSRSLSRVFDGPLLEDVRKRLKTLLRSLRWSAGPNGPVAGRDQELFEVWIHEDDPAETADSTTFEISLREIGDADIIVVLYTGEAGSAAHDRDIGICHAELQEALQRRPEIVSLIRLEPLSTSSLDRDVRFRAFVDERFAFAKSASSEGALRQIVVELLQQRVALLIQRGARGVKARHDRGQALTWNELDLTKRQEVMREALAAALGGKTVAGAPANDLLVRMPLLSEQEILARVDAIPAQLSVAAARERVGQPFLRDHLLAPILEQERLAGPLHVVACHGGASLAQASRIVGTPDSILVQGEFGVYAADHLQKIQLVLLAHCTDAASIAVAVRHFREWLRTSGEEERAIRRAQARQRILKAVAAEV
jgi:hypothetical protein